MSMPPRLLRIDSSARLHGSVSRRLADRIESAWQLANPNGDIRRRDLAQQSPPHIDQLTIEGFYAPDGAMSAEQRAATALSDELLTELKSSTTLLLSAPIYNFSVPSALKAWIDQIVRINHSFAYDGERFSGLLPGPHAVLALAYGAAGYQGPLQVMDHLQPYLRQLLGFLGASRVDVISAEATSSGATTVEAALAAAEPRIAALFTEASA